MEDNAFSDKASVSVVVDDENPVPVSLPDDTNDISQRSGNLDTEKRRHLEEDEDDKNGDRHRRKKKKVVLAELCIVILRCFLTLSNLKMDHRARIGSVSTKTRTKTETETEMAEKESIEIRIEMVKIEGIEIMIAKGDPKTVVR